MANGDFGGGYGTLKEPYLVEDVLDLNAVRHNLFGYYYQTNDIYLEEKWDPIGPMFQGGYDGGFHKIDNLNVEEGVNGSLFVFLYGATIKNLAVGYTFVPEKLDCDSGLAQGSYNTVFDNCYIMGQVTTGDSVSEFLLLNGTNGDSEDWVCRSRHPFYKEKVLRSSVQKRKGTGACKLNAGGSSCDGCTKIGQLLEER